MNEPTLSVQIQQNITEPVTTVDCARHHGMEKRPAPTTLLIRLTVDERRVELANWLVGVVPEVSRDLVPDSRVQPEWNSTGGTARKSTAGSGSDCSRAMGAPLMEGGPASLINTVRDLDNGGAQDRRDRGAIALSTILE